MDTGMDTAQVVVVSLLIGVATARVVETVKEALPFIAPPAHKSVCATVIATATSATLISTGWRERVLAAGGAAGIAMITHVITDLASVTADRQKIHVLRAAAR